MSSNAEVAEQADLVVLCHKPAQLQSVAEEVAPHAGAVASILAATPLAVLEEAYPRRPVYRFIPSLPVEVRQGAVVQAARPRPPSGDRRGGRRAVRRAGNPGRAGGRLWLTWRRA